MDNASTDEASELRARILYGAMMAAGDRLLTALDKEHKLTLMGNADAVFEQWKAQREIVGELSQLYAETVSRWRQAIEEAATT